MEESSPAAPDLGFAALVLLFAACVLIVLGWLLRVTRGPSLQPAGARSLLVALCSFPTVRGSWAKAWVQALNREALRSQSSVQMQLEENIVLEPSVRVSQVWCAERAGGRMVLLCSLSANTVTFPVSVTLQSPAAVSCHTYQVSLTVQQAQIEIQLHELPEEGLLVSWGFKEQPDVLLQVDPRQSQQREEGAELCTVQDVLRSALLTAQPAMMFSLRARDGDQLHIPDMSLIHTTTLGTSSQRINITPTKKVEMDRIVMPDGTIVTTVTTIQSRPRLDGRMDSPASSPSKVEVTENKPVILPQSDSSGFSPSDSGGSPASIKLDPVAETAIRQLTEPGNKSTKRTPTKRSTLIISGVSKVPVAEDEMALSLGYAASMDASLQGPSSSFQGSDASYFLSDVTPSIGQEADETTKSEISDRASVEDLESDTGSAAALDTRSLKDHKVGFLRSGTKLLFRWHHRHAGLSQSHDDLTNGTRKKRAHFPRRLFKRFSLKTKPSANGSAPAGDK